MNWDLDLEQPFCQTVDRDPSARWSVTSNKKLFLVRPCPECTEAKCCTPRSSPHTPPDPVLPALLRSTFSQWKLWAAFCIPARVTDGNWVDAEHPGQSFIPEWSEREHWDPYYIRAEVEEGGDLQYHDSSSWFSKPKNAGTQVFTLLFFFSDRY